MAPTDLISELPASPPVEQRFRRQMGQVSRHTSVFFAGTIFTAAAGYVFKVYLARVLGAEALGIYALGMTIVGFLGIFNALGLPQTAVRFVAAYSATGKMELLRGFIAHGLLLLLTTNLLLGAGVLLAGRWIAVHFYHTPALSQYLGLFALIMFFGALTTFLGQVLAGYKDVARRTVITNFIGTPVMMLLTLALVTLGFGLWGYIFAQVLSAVVTLVLLAIMVWKLTPKSARSLTAPLPRMENRVISFSAVAFGVSFLEFTMGQADKVMIGFYLNAREVGIYAVAAALVVFVPTILQSVNQIFAPTISDLHSRGDLQLLGRMFQTLTKWIFGLTVPLAAVMMVFSRPLMQIFGHDFEMGWPILIIGTIGQLVNCGVGSVGYLLLMSGHERRLMRIQTVMALVMVLFTLLLIPRWGIIGAAAAAAITNFASNLWCLREVHSTLGILPYTRSYLKLAPPIAATGIVLWLVRAELRGLPHQWVVIGIGLVAGYAAFIASALLVGLDADDRLIADAVWYRISSTFRKPEAGV